MPCYQKIPNHNSLVMGGSCVVKVVAEDCGIIMCVIIARDSMRYSNAIVIIRIIRAGIADDSQIRHEYWTLRA